MKLSVVLSMAMASLALADFNDVAIFYTEVNYQGETIELPDIYGPDFCWSPPEEFKHNIGSIEIKGTKYSCNLYSEEDCQGSAYANIGRSVPDIFKDGLGQKLVNAKCKKSE